MSSIENITSSRGKRRQFFIRVNTDLEFRQQFLDDPLQTLRDFGFSLSGDAEEEIVEMVNYLKALPGINQLPHGYSAVLRGMGARNPPESALIGLLIQ